MAENRLLDLFSPEVQQAQGNLLSKYLGQSLLRRSVLDDVTGKPVITSAPTGEVTTRANLLPLGITDEGRMTVALPQAVLGAYDASLFPGQVARGEKGVFDPATGHVSQEAMDAANGIAGLAMTGGLGGAAVRQGRQRWALARSAPIMVHRTISTSSACQRSARGRAPKLMGTGFILLGMKGSLSTIAISSALAPNLPLIEIPLPPTHHSRSPLLTWLLP
ncbi:hypothetical protein ACFQFG_22735 [Methylobacterium persicinum]